MFKALVFLPFRSDYLIYKAAFVWSFIMLIDELLFSSMVFFENWKPKHISNSAVKRLEFIIFLVGDFYQYLKNKCFKN